MGSFIHIIQPNGHIRENERRHMHKHDPGQALSHDNQCEPKDIKYTSNRVHVFIFEAQQKRGRSHRQRGRSLPQKLAPNSSLAKMLQKTASTINFGEGISVPKHACGLCMSPLLPWLFLGFRFCIFSDFRKIIA